MSSENSLPGDSPAAVPSGAMLPSPLSVPVEAAVPVPVPEPEPRLLFTPPIDIYETPDGLVLYADLPGVTADSLDLQVQDKRLTLYGRVQQPAGAPEAVLEGWVLPGLVDVLADQPLPPGDRPLPPPSPGAPGHVGPGGDGQ